MGPSEGQRDFESHGISFDEASTAFRDTLSLAIYDPLHSDKEDRFVLIGNSHRNRLLVVVQTERADRVETDQREKGIEERKEAI